MVMSVFIFKKVGELGVTFLLAGVYIVGPIVSFAPVFSFIYCRVLFFALSLVIS